MTNPTTKWTEQSFCLSSKEVVLSSREMIHMFSGNEITVARPGDDMPRKWQRWSWWWKWCWRQLQERLSIWKVLNMASWDQVEITDSSCHGLICQDTAYKFKFQQRALTWKHLQLLLLDTPETTRQRTNCWLNTGTSVLARKIRPARQSWARQIRIPTKSENAMNVGHVAAGTTMLFTRPGL